MVHCRKTGFRQLKNQEFDSMYIFYGQPLHGFQKLNNTPLQNAIRTTGHQEDQNPWISLHQDAE